MKRFFLLTVALLTVCCLLLKPEKLRIDEEFPEKLNRRRTAVYLALFALSLAIAALVIWAHRSNIGRLLHGTESRFQWHTNGPGRS